MKTIAPRHLEDDIWANEIVASIEHTNIALAAANVDELERVSMSRDIA